MRSSLVSLPVEGRLLLSCRKTKERHENKYNCVLNKCEIVIEMCLQPSHNREGLFIPFSSYLQNHGTTYCLEQLYRIYTSKQQGKTQHNIIIHRFSHFVKSRTLGLFAQFSLASNSVQNSLGLRIISFFFSASKQYFA